MDEYATGGGHDKSVVARLQDLSDTCFRSSDVLDSGSAQTEFTDRYAAESLVPTKLVYNTVCEPLEQSHKLS